MLSLDALSKAMWVRQRGECAVPNRRQLHPGEIVLLLLLREKSQNRKVGNKNFSKNLFGHGKCGEFMSFRNSQSYKELQADWRWIHSMDPEAAAAADQWVKEHPEEWKELEHILYYSEANFHKRVAPDTLEDVDIKQPASYNPEAFLPEEVRNAIYDDMRWFDRAKYLPEGSDEDPLMYVSKEFDEGLHELTELQREILFRTVINGESTESVARDKQCSSRNIRDIRARALRQLKSKITRREGSGSTVTLFFVLLALFAFYFGIEIIVERLLPLYPWLEYVGYVLAAAIAIPVIFRFKDREVEGLLRNLWASKNGSQRKE